MQIYLLDLDPTSCAQMLDDKSLDKQIKAIANVLCEVHYELQMLGLEKDTYIPSFKNPTRTSIWCEWASKYRANYSFLVNLLDACLEELLYRSEVDDSFYFYNKNRLIYEWARDNRSVLPDHLKTPFPLVIPKKFVDSNDSIVTSYRRAYAYKKLRTENRDTYTWTQRNKPDWLL